MVRLSTKRTFDLSFIVCINDFEQVFVRWDVRAREKNINKITT